MGFASKIERIVKPRMRFLRRWRGMMNLIGVSIASSGLILSLPLPIPLSNVVPAWAALFLATGMMERDGLLVLIGHVLSLASWALLLMWWFLGVRVFENLFG